MSTSRATVVFGRAFRYTPIRTGSDLRSQVALQKISHLLQIPLLLFHMGRVPAILEDHYICAGNTPDRLHWLVRAKAGQYNPQA